MFAPSFVVPNEQDQKTYIDAGRNTDLKKCDITVQYLLKKIDLEMLPHLKIPECF